MVPYADGGEYLTLDLEEWTLDSQQWTQYKIKGKYFNRIRITKEEFLKECSSCHARVSYFHIVGCLAELSPCKFCMATYVTECKCPFHKDEDE